MLLSSAAAAPSVEVELRVLPPVAIESVCEAVALGSGCRQSGTGRDSLTPSTCGVVPLLGMGL